jgi:hypothetical protein
MKWLGYVLALLAIVGAGLMAYGYWYASTHGALSIFVMDVSDPQRTHPLVPVELTFRDAAGTVLATAAGIDPSGGTFLTSPPEYACHAAEERAAVNAAARPEWDRCFEDQSRWVSTWIRKAASIDVRTPQCSMEKLPVSLAEYSDWWSWWVPLRHVGGNPNTLYSVSLRIDSAACQPRG